MRARRRIVDLPIPRQLISLLTVFPAALTVPLPRQAAIPAVRLADKPQRQRDIDERQRVVHTLRLLLSTPRRQHHCRARLAKHVRRPHQVRLRHSRDPLHTLRPVCRYQPAHRSKPLRPLLYVVRIYQPVPHQYVQNPVRKRGVRARCQSQVQVCPLRRRSQARVSDYEPPAIRPLRLEILHYRRHRL